MADRIAKVIAHSGICSRRDAEKLIEQGLVKVNGKTLETPAFLVEETDKIEVDGKLLKAPEQPRLWLYHKPKGLITTHKDPEGRPTVFENLPEELPRVISVGRLDLYSEGLLLLTTSGGLARTLEHPSSNLKRVYDVQIEGKVNQETLDTLKEGINIDGIEYQPIQAKLLRRQGFRYWVEFTLNEGKNREIRNVIEYLGWRTARLIRKSYGPFELGSLESEKIREAPFSKLKRFLS